MDPAKVFSAAEDSVELPDVAHVFDPIYPVPTPGTEEQFAPLPTTPSLHELGELRRLIAEAARRRCESINLYEPLPAQADFLASRAKQRLARGGNRSGKTTLAAVAVARAVTGRDPLAPAQDGRYYLVGKNLDHVGQVMWRKLARAGAFRIVRDPVSWQWRAFRPWCDGALAAVSRPAPPLLPPRLIKTIAWENKAKGIPKQVTLHNGWELSFYSSEGKPPQGSDLDGVWFDEEITDEDWYPEMMGRLLDRAGRFIWSATPQAGTDKLLDLHEQADRERGTENPSVAEFVILLKDNPHIAEQEKRAFEASLNEDQRRVRIDGDFAVNRLRVYPEFREAVHCYPGFAIPPTWTRYYVIDPGRQVCAVLFVAVPPPDGEREGEGNFVYFYDELYIRDCDAEEFGRRMAEHCNGQSFRAGIIDDHGARVADTGSGRTIRSQYSDALKKYKIRTDTTGHGFIPAYDDVETGVEMFRSWLLLREDGTPKLRVFAERCRNFIREIKRYRYQVIRGTVSDRPESRGDVHLMACARYAAAFRPRHAPQRKQTTTTNSVLSALQAKKNRQAARARAEGGAQIRLGPGRG